MLVFSDCPPIVRPPYGDGIVQPRSMPKVVILAEAQGWRCPYCTSVMTYDPTRGSRTPKTDATIDHYRATVAGGRKVWENEIAACFSCNVYKGAYSAMLFWLLMQVHAFDRRKVIRQLGRMKKKQRSKFLDRWRRGQIVIAAPPSSMGAQG